MHSLSTMASPFLPLTIILCIAPFISSVTDHLLSPSTFPTDYQKMISTLKIFPYSPLPFNLTPTPSLFHSLLLSSPFITPNPTLAHLFYLPTPPTLPTRSLERVISRLRSSLPFWNRSLAADHFFLSSPSPSPSSSRNVVELFKNAVRISPFPSPTRFFIPHKDLSLPPVPRTRSSRTRSVRIYKSSRFCLFSYGGGDFEVVGLGEALAFGCVPVMITDRPIQDMPLMDVLRWQQIALFVGSGVGPAGLKRVLSEVVEGGGYERMRRSGVAAAHHFVWNDPPKPYDAFHMVVYQLWLRRHAVRYDTSTSEIM